MTEHIEVGVTNRDEVAINLGRDITGHITFTPQQADHLAGLLVSKANEIRRKQKDAEQPECDDEMSRSPICDWLSELISDLAAVVVKCKHPKRVSLGRAPSGRLAVTDGDLMLDMYDRMCGSKGMTVREHLAHAIEVAHQEFE